MGGEWGEPGEAGAVDRLASPRGGGRDRLGSSASKQTVISGATPSHTSPAAATPSQGSPAPVPAGPPKMSGNATTPVTHNAAAAATTGADWPQATLRFSLMTRLLRANRSPQRRLGACSSSPST